MASATSKALELADANTKSTVYGYCRIIQQLLASKHNDNPFYVIPIGIIHIVLSYYFIIEQFIECGNKYIVISDEKRRTVHNPKAHWDTAYGTFRINCDDKMNKDKIFKWILNVDNDGSRCVTIGIDETKRKWINSHFKMKKDSINYAYNADGTGYASHMRANVCERTHVSYGAGDRITMILNIMDKTLIFYKCKQTMPETEMGGQVCKFISVRTNAVEYCLAVYLWHKGKISIIDFVVESAS